MAACKSKVAALILAAGFSSRMGAFKPLLPFDENSVIATAVNSFRQAGIFDIRVVIGYQADKILPVLKELQVRPVLNERYAEGMFSSVFAGVQTFNTQTSAFFLLPVDTPLIKRHSLKAMLRLYRRTGAAVVFPTFQGKSGHPPLIDQQCFGDILAAEGAGTLKIILKRFLCSAAELELPDRGIILDMDTPQDYARLKRYSQAKQLPVREEALALLHARQTPRVIRHCLAVAAVGRQLAKRLNQSGLNLDLALITVGGLLHDIAKGQPQHARRGGRLLTSFGYPRLGTVIASHMDFVFDEHSFLDEAAIVFFADKVIREGRIVPLQNRFREPLRKYSGQPDVLYAIEKRFNSVQRIRTEIIRILAATAEPGRSLPTYLRYPGEILEGEGRHSGCC